MERSAQLEAYAHPPQYRYTNHNSVWIRDDRSVASFFTGSARVVAFDSRQPPSDLTRGLRAPTNCSPTGCSARGSAGHCSVTAHSRPRRVSTAPCCARPATSAECATDPASPPPPARQRSTRRRRAGPCGSDTPPPPTAASPRHHPQAPLPPPANAHSKRPPTTYTPGRQREELRPWEAW